MAQIYLFGVPKGFQNSTCDANTADFLAYFYAPRKNEMSLDIQRRGNKMYYSFLVDAKNEHFFSDINGRAGSFLGLSLVLENKYITDKERLKKLFLAVYDQYIKNQIIQEYPNGNRKWLTQDMDAAIKHVANGMQHLINNTPELNIWASLQTLPTIRPQNNQIRR